MADLVEKELGAEANISAKFEDAKLKLRISYQGKGGSAAVDLALDSDYALDLIKEAIPGEYDDKVIDLIKAAAKGV